MRNLTTIYSPYDNRQLTDKNMAVMLVILRQGHTVNLYQSYTTSLSRYPWNQERPYDNIL